MVQTQVCQLCDSPASEDFCCQGCATVYEVLQARGELAGAKESPLFREAVRTGIISNPAFSSEQNEEEKETHHLLLEIEMLWCPSCARVLDWVIGQRKGVARCHVDYATDLAHISYSPDVVGREAIALEFSRLGYPARPLEEREMGSRQLTLRMMIALFCAMQVMLFSWPLYWGHTLPMYRLLAAIFCLPVAFVGLLPLLRRFVLSVASGIFGMETLIVVSSTAGLAISYWNLWQGRGELFFDSIAALLTFLLVGKFLEQRAKFSAKQSLHALLRGMPKRAVRIDSRGGEHPVLVKDIRVGDRLVVRTGEKIPLDGVVISGEGICNEAWMSGEALPKTKGEGDDLIAGSIIQQGRLVFEAKVTANTSSYTRMVEMVEGDLPQKQESVRLVDRIVSWFIPTVLLLAAGMSLFSLERALTLLLIACPCAIGIAAPLVETLLLHRLAQRGILVRNRRVFATLGKETLFALDKTGTVTEGKLQVVGGLEALSDKLLRITKGLSLLSNHPVSRSLADTISGEPMAIESGKEEIGYGVSGWIEGKRYVLGSKRFLAREGIEAGEGMVFLGCKGECLGAFLLTDTLREGMEKQVEALGKNARVVLLSGDRKEVVDAIGRACKIAETYGEMHPLEKREWIVEQRAQGEIVAMVGDGVNDAAPLAVADCGVAVFSAADASKQVADLVLTHANFPLLLAAGQDARAVRRIVRQNLFWAFAYNAIGMGLALSGVLTPLFAATGMIFSSGVTLLNSYRFTREKTGGAG